MIKLKSGYEIKSVEGVNIVVPTGNDMSFSGVITLNDTALFVWNQLIDGIEEDDLVALMAKEYDVDKSIISADVKELIEAFKQNGLLEG